MSRARERLDAALICLLRRRPKLPPESDLTDPASTSLGKPVKFGPNTIAFPPPPIHRRLVKVREVIRVIEGDGWYLVRTRGSYRQFKHPSKPGLVTIAGNLQDDLAVGTLNSILRQAGLKK